MYKLHQNGSYTPNEDELTELNSSHAEVLEIIFQLRLNHDESQELFWILISLNFVQSICKRNLK